MQDLEPPEVPIFLDKDVNINLVENKKKSSKNTKKSVSTTLNNSLREDNIIMPAFDTIDKSLSNVITPVSSLPQQNTSLGGVPDGLVLPQLDVAKSELLSLQQGSDQKPVMNEEKQGLLKKIFSAFKPKHSLEEPAKQSFENMQEADFLKNPLPSLSDMPSPPAQQDAVGNINPGSTIPAFNIIGEAPVSDLKDSPVKKADNIKSPANNSFDWTNPETQADTFAFQDDAALKVNKEIKDMISGAAEHVDEKSLLTLPPIPSIDIPKTDFSAQPLSQTHLELNNIINPVQAPADEQSIVPKMPQLDAKEHTFFRKLDQDHSKLKNVLLKKVTGKGALDKAGFLALLKQYDEKIEHKIERSEIEISQKKSKLEKFHKTLKQKELELKRLHAYLHSMNADLKEKHAHLRQVISTTVSKELARRTEKERALLKRELKRTIALNSRLQKKLDIIDDDMKKFYIKRDKLLSEEQYKLNKYQQIYEQKLQELKKEKEQFEQQKKSAMQLLSKGDEMAQEFEKLEDARKIVERSKKAISKDIDTDKELKRAIDAAETRLKKEKGDLDKMIFSKYIVERLRSIRPESMISDSPVEETVSYDGEKIYALIKDCKKQILAKDVDAAKKTYAQMKSVFETGRFNAAEKAMLYNSIRALYSDIQLAVIDI